jgi:thioredoxin-like negative regulator of GroEL
MKQLLPLILLSATIGINARADVKFLTGTFKEALSRAEAEKKPVMIDFTTDWCRWCDTLDVRTYSDAKVTEFVHNSVIPFKIDAEKGEGIEIAKKYVVRAYPTILLITSDGEEIDRMLGFMPPEPFLKALQDYLKGVNTVAALKTELEKNPNNAAVQYQMARKYAERNDLAAATGYYKKLLELDPKNEHAEEANFTIAMNALRTDKNPGALAAFLEKYQESQMAGQAAMTLAGYYVKEKKVEEAQKLYDRYFEKRPDDAAAMNNIAWNLAGQKLLLDYSANLAAKAVSLAKTDEEKAMYLDTQATVEFNRGNVAKAISLEETALGLLKDAPEKTRKEYESTLAKFKAGASSAAGK